MCWKKLLFLIAVLFSCTHLAQIDWTYLRTILLVNLNHYSYGVRKLTKWYKYILCLDKSDQPDTELNFFKHSWSFFFTHWNLFENQTFRFCTFKELSKNLLKINLNEEIMINYAERILFSVWLVTFIQVERSVLRKDWYSRGAGTFPTKVIWPKTRVTSTQSLLINRPMVFLSPILSIEHTTPDISINWHQSE